MAKVQEIFAIMGSMRTGKDTLVGYLAEEFYANKIPTMELSSIDCVRELLAKIGFDTSKKTDADRRLLSDLGYSLERYNSFRSRTVLQQYQEGLKRVNNGSLVCFVQIREMYLANKIAAIAKTHLGVGVTKVLVKRASRLDGGSFLGVSESDDQIAKEPERNFDFIITNNGGLPDLEYQAQELVRQFVFARENKTTGV